MLLAYSALLTPLAILYYFAPASLRRGSTVMIHFESIVVRSLSRFDTVITRARARARTRKAYHLSPNQSCIHQSDTQVLAIIIVSHIMIMFMGIYAACILCFIDPLGNSFLFGTSELETG